MESIMQFFQQISDFITNGLYDFFVGAFVWLLQKLFILWLEAKIWALKFSWSLASGFVDSVGVSSLISSSFSGLSPSTTALMALFRIPEAINIFLSCCVTRYALKFVPGGW